MLNLLSVFYLKSVQPKDQSLGSVGISNLASVESPFNYKRICGIQVDQVLETSLKTACYNPLVAYEISLVGHKQNFCLLYLYVQLCVLGFV